MKLIIMEKYSSWCYRCNYTQTFHNLTVEQEIFFLAMNAYAHIIFYSTDTYYLPLNLSLCICIVMLVTWHVDPQTFFKKVCLCLQRNGWFIQVHCPQVGKLEETVFGLSLVLLVRFGAVTVLYRFVTKLFEHIMMLLYFVKRDLTMFPTLSTLANYHHVYRIFVIQVNRVITMCTHIWYLTVKLPVCKTGSLLQTQKSHTINVKK